MRKNTKMVLESFEGHKARGKRGDSVWTDGESIFSYGTVIAERRPDLAGGIAFNTTVYSRTTSVHQKGVREHLDGRAHLDGEGLTAEVADVPTGEMSLEAYPAMVWHR